MVGGGQTGRRGIVTVRAKWAKPPDVARQVERNEDSVARIVSWTTIGMGDIGKDTLIPNREMM